MRCTRAFSAASSAAMRACSAFSAATSPAADTALACGRLERGRTAARRRQRRLAAQQVGPASLTLARAARQLDGQRHRLAGQFFQETVHRRDVGEAVQPLAVQAQLGRGLRPAQHQHGQQRHGLAGHLQHRGAVVLELHDAAAAALEHQAQALQAVQSRQHLGVGGLDHRVDARSSGCSRHQRVQRQRVGVGHGGLLLDQHAQHAGLQRRQCAQGLVPPKPSSAAMTAPLTKWLWLAHSIISTASRSEGLPTRLRGSMLTSFWPASVCHWWWLISVSM